MSAELWMWLAAGLGFGAVNSGEILAKYPGGAKEIAENLGSASMDELLTQKQAQRLSQTRPADFSLRLAHAATYGVVPIGFDSQDYPAMLREIHNPPPILFAKGDVSLLNGQLSIGMVGTRKPSAYGMEAMKKIGRGVALGGAIIVSGLAAGLDSEAHKAALAVNGPTIACIAFGHDTCYPKQNQRLMELIESYGLVLSEYPVGTQPEKPYFLQRNRIIAGLSHGLLVCEARQHSGTMSTVNYAADYGREVFAVPGSIFSELSGGTNGLIKEGAYLAAAASDILAIYGIDYQDEPFKSTESASSQQTTLDENPQPRVNKDMTMAEALQTAAGKTDGESLDARQAVDAFAKLQTEIYDGKDEKTSRSREYVVSEMQQSLEAGQKPKKAAEEISFGKKIKEFSWAKAERLSKNDIKEQLSSLPEAEELPKSNAASTPQQKPKVSPVYKSRPAPVQPVGSVQPVGALYGVEAVSPVAYGAPVQELYAPYEYEQGYAYRPKQQNEWQSTPQGHDTVIIHSAAPQQQMPENGAQAFNTQQAQQPQAQQPAPVIRTSAQKAQPAQAASTPAQRTQPVLKPQAAQKIETGNNEPPAVIDKINEQTVFEQDRQYSGKQAAEYKRPLPTADKKQAAQPQAKKADERKTALNKSAQSARARQSAFEDNRPPAQSFSASGTRYAGQAGAKIPKEIKSVKKLLSEEELRLTSFINAEKAEDEAAAATDSISNSAKKALQALTATPKGLNQIVEESGLSLGETMAALTELELEGLSRQLAGRQFVIMQ